MLYSALSIPGLALLLALTMFAAPAVADKRLPFEEQQLADGVHLFVPTDLGADGLSRTNSLVVELAKGLLVVGAQPTPQAARELLAQIDRKYEAEIRYLVLTHPTIVVSGGAVAFPDAVEVIASAEFLDTLADPAFDTAGELRSVKGADWQPPTIRRPSIAFRGKAVLDDERHPVSIELVTPAYSPGGIAVRLPKDELLYLGATVFEPGSVPYADVADIGAWISTLNRLISRREVGCIPRVGPPSTRQTMQANRDAFAWLRGHVESAFLKRTPVAEIPAVVMGADGIEEHFGTGDRDRLAVLVGKALDESIRERKKRGIPTP